MKYVRNVLATLGLLLMFLYPISSPVQAAEVEWNQFRENSANNPVLENDQLEKNLRNKIETKNEVRSTPVIIEDRIFVGNHDTGELSAFDLETGDLLWENQAPNWVHSEMIYVDDQIFVGYGNRSMQDEGGIRGTGESGMMSLDPDTGETLWVFETLGEVMPTPAFYDGLVYIVTGDKHVYGVHPDTGEEEWSLDLGSRSNMSSPNIKDGILYVGGSGPFVFSAVDLDERELLWQHEIEKVTTGLGDVPPVVSEDNVVYTTAVSELDERVTMRDIFNEVGMLRGMKYGLLTNIINFIEDGEEPDKLYEHKMYAFDATNGDLLWESSLGKGRMIPHNKSGAPMLYEDRVYVGSPITQKFYSFDAESGDEVWRYNGYINKAPPVADDGVVYFSDTRGLVYGFDPESGDLIGKKRLGGKLSPSGPVLVNDHLVIGSQDHHVYIEPTEEILEADDKPEEGEE